MPVGDLDRRRAGHRCAPCKKLHAKCNGGQPCSNCVARGLDCTAATKSASKGFRFVYQQKTADVPRPLVQTSWSYINIYFQSVGYLTQVSVLRGPSVATLSHEDENVSRTLSIIGGIYACHSRNIMQLKKAETLRIMDTYMKQKFVVEAELENPDMARFSSILLNALLLGVVELIFNRVENSFHTWLEKVSSFLVSYTNSSAFSSFTPFERSLIRVFQMLDVLLALARNTPPIGPRLFAGSLSMTEQTMGPDQDVETWTDDMKIDGMLSTMWQWAIMRPKMIAWITAVEEQQKQQEQNESPPDDNQTPPPLTIESKVQGLNIICEASALQIRMIENIFQLSQTPQDHVTLCMTPYYHWALTGLSHNLRHRTWKLLSCEVPVMPKESLHQQALVALDSLETLVEKPGMDLALYLPVADMVGHQLETDVERARMLKFLSIVMARGFNVADEYRQLLLGVWSGCCQPVIKPAENLCQWGV